MYGHSVYWFTDRLVCSHLERSVSVRFFPAEVDLPGDGQTHEEPVAKTIVVDELEDIFHRQVDQWHDTLDGGRRNKGTMENREKKRDVSECHRVFVSLAPLLKWSEVEGWFNERSVMFITSKELPDTFSFHHNQIPF